MFPNEDATRFDLVKKLYTLALPVKMPTSMLQFAPWLENWMTKLSAPAVLQSEKAASGLHFSNFLGI